MIVCFGMAGFSEENYILGNIDQVKLTVISWMSCPRTNPISFYMYLFNSSTIQVSRAWNLIAFCCEKQKQNHNNKTFVAEKKEYVKQTWVEERVTERENTVTRMRICSEPQTKRFRHTNALIQYFSFMSSNIACQHNTLEH